jgi:hypothetical protein
MKATAYFEGDSSVGIYSYSYTLEIPFDEDIRDDIRQEIAKLYNDLDGEFSCRVIFEDETGKDI